MKSYIDIEILEGIRTADNDVINWLRKIYFEQINEQIVGSTGYYSDSENIFQLAILTIFKRIRENKIDLKTSFHNYFLGFCKYIWHRECSNCDNSNKYIDLSNYEYNEENDVIDVKTEKIILEQIGKSEKINKSEIIELIKKEFKYTDYI